MNLTTSTNSPRSNWKRVTTHTVSAVAGVALALGAIAGLPGSPKSSDAAVVSASSVVPVTAQRFAGQSQLQIVLVNNAGQQERLQTQFASDEYISGYTLLNPPIVAVKGSPMEQSLEAIAAYGWDVKVTDLTQTARTVTAAAKASEADIAASVLSTELANYLAPVATAKASDADVLASARSSEAAAYGFGAQPVQHQVSDADLAASVISSEKAAGY